MLKSSIDHDCKICDLVHIAPGATLSGGVNVGEGSHIATGANVIQCVNIGQRCILGAGLTLRRDMRDEENYTGGVIRENDGKK